jgi:hypothetical protein
MKISLGGIMMFDLININKNDDKVFRTCQVRPDAAESLRKRRGEYAAISEQDGDYFTLFFRDQTYARLHRDQLTGFK